MKKQLIGLGVAALMFGGGVSADAGTISYNATTDFSITGENPNGVWSYGWMSSDLSSFSAFTSTNDSLYGFDIWSSPEIFTNSLPLVGINASGTTNYGIDPGQLVLHAGPNGEAAALRFTATTEGSYDIAGQFLTGDTGIMQVGIRQETDWLWNATDSGIFSINDQMFSAGETIDFIVYGSYYYGSTGLELTVSTETDPVPEPATMLLFGAGLAGLAGWRKKQAKK